VYCFVHFEINFIQTSNLKDISQQTCAYQDWHIGFETGITVTLDVACHHSLLFTT